MVELSDPVVAAANPLGAAAADSGHASARPEPEPTAARTPDAPPSSRLALRDYFVARSEQAGLLWIYRERLSASQAADDAAAAGYWYLQGLFG